MEGANYEGPDRLSLKILMRCEALMARLVVHRVPPRDELLYDLPLLFCSSLRAQIYEKIQIPLLE